ncbi:MAG: hypothetical protein AB7G17_09600 [Phycisphaerales bacterium]
MTNATKISIIAVAGFMTSIAGANTLNLQFTGVGLRESVKVTDTSLGITNMNVNAGEIQYKTLTGTNAPGFSVGQMISTFCMDLSQNVSNGILTLVGLESGPVPGPQMGAERASLLRNLYATSYATAFTNNTAAAAFQLAVWEIINEANLDASQGTRGLAGIDVNGGDFKATNNANARTQANLYLDQAFLAFKDGLTGYNLMAGVSPTAQDQIFIVSVPMPSAAGLGFVGLASLGLRRRR